MNRLLQPKIIKEPTENLKKFTSALQPYFYIYTKIKQNKQFGKEIIKSIKNTKDKAFNMKTNHKLEYDVFQSIH